MRYLIILFIASFICSNLVAQQKKAITHDMYDGWKSVGERYISNDGNYIVYTITPQEGDGDLFVENLSTGYKKHIARGYSAQISYDSRYMVAKIKPFYQDTRQARIKKKRPDEMPKDSLVIIELGSDSITRISRIKAFQMPEKAAGWLAWHAEKPLPDTAAAKRKPAAIDSNKLKVDKLAKIADSIIRKSLDSVNGKIEKEALIKVAEKAAKEIYKSADEITMTDAEGDDGPAGAGGAEGTDLVLKQWSTGKTRTFKGVEIFTFDEKGNMLVMKVSKNKKDSASKPLLLVYHLTGDKTDTVMKGFNDIKSINFDEAGKQLAFLAERDSSAKALQKFYRLWYYTPGADSAIVIADGNTAGMSQNYSVSENSPPRFSKNGEKIFFGVAPIQPPKDTTLVDFELARLDIWHYNDELLQPMQLKQLAMETRRSFLAVTRPGSNKIVQLGADDAENVSLVDEGNADWVLAQSTKGNRQAIQWEGRAKSTGYIIDVNTGTRQLVSKNSYPVQASVNGKYIIWYNPEVKNYFTYDIATKITKNITSAIKVPLYDTENDVPDLPGAIGVAGWLKNDAAVLINDEYDMWEVDPKGILPPKNITKGWGRANKISFNYVNTNREIRYIDPAETWLLTGFNHKTKYGGYYNLTIGNAPQLIDSGAYAIANVAKAKNAGKFLLQKPTPSSAELYYGTAFNSLQKVTDVAEQQKDINWFTPELVKWKMFDGKMSEGILFKPENFDPTKKYPVIFYFYERNSDGLYNYRAPAPSASTINIPYFVSNGYLVFDPNIYYKTGEPGESAYNSVVSAAKYLSKMPWVDSTRMAIQGQSWGGYQVSYLVTRTNMFRAAGAGAPVSNMTSAYGGIRWGTGMNRQFQYEKTQSRIGATLWEKPQLYIKNSPLFTANKVNTPLLIMHNDQDGAVPWYQGIEYFTALKRLGKKVWMLQYNGEDHNLVERRNRKDLSIRLAQFFDYYLKDAKPAKWITDGLPATQKGKTWATEVE